MNCQNCEVTKPSLPSDDLETTNSAGKERESFMMEPEDFAGLSREEQLKEEWRTLIGPDPARYCVLIG